MEEISLLSTGFKAIAMLFIVLGFMIFVLFLIKRFLLSRGRAERGMFVTTLASIHFSPKQRLEVVEVMGEKLVLGITPGTISFLTKLSDYPANRKEPQGSNKDFEIKE
jgi:flagellar protein FliO/FliZ